MEIKEYGSVQINFSDSGHSSFEVRGFVFSLAPGENEETAKIAVLNRIRADALFHILEARDDTTYIEDLTITNTVN